MTDDRRASSSRRPARTARICAWLAVLLLPTGGAWAAEVPAPLRAWLHATDESPTADQLRRASPAIVRDLVAVADDRREHRFARNRAVALLSRLGQDDADAALVRLAERGDRAERATAWLALGAGPGVRRPDWALRQFLRAGRQPEARIRAAAARGLGLVAAPARARLVAQRLRAKERDADVQQLLEIVVRRGRAAPRR